MRLIETNLPEVKLIEPSIFSDERGFFFESYNLSRFAELGIKNNFVQDNHSKSIKGTIRGLHYQLNHPQAKLCRVTRGEVLDVVVDIRAGSPYFGKYTSAILSAENHRQIYIPEGFAHGFQVLSSVAEFLYKCSDFYYAEDERGVLWCDPEIGIDWRGDNPILSEKDLRNPRLRDIEVSQLPRFSEDSK